MKKNLKNIILIVIMVLSVVGISLTVLYAKNNATNDVGAPEMMGGGNMDFAGEMPSGDMGSIPDMPSDGDSETPSMPENGRNNAFGDRQDMKDDNMGNRFENNKNTLTTSQIIIISVFSLTFTLSLMYLIMSRKDNKFYKITDKLVIYILSSIILTGVIACGTTYISNNFILNNVKMSSESEEKDKVTLDKTNIVTSSNIDLSNETTDVTITTGGTYTITGSFTHALIIDADTEDVELILNNVTIENSETAAIIGLSANKITINLNEGSTNTLSDGGNSEYDGCIFSNAELEFKGSGTLIVNGNQNEGEGIATETQNITFNGGTYIVTSNDDGINAGGDGATITINDGVFYIDASGDGIDSNKNAIINGGTIFVMGSDIEGDAGIDTDDGFTINGGVVVALGSDMIETPLESSKQNAICFSLSNSISKDTIVTLMKDDEEIVSFSASKSFKTIIISTDTLTNGTYELYTGGTNTGTLVNGIYQNSNYTKGDLLTVNNKTSFEVSSTINLFR